jgi:drug/metabolite transporter (DMT)-like permease
MLLALGAIWGASFMFLKIALRDLAPASIIAGRVVLGLLTLAVVVPFLPGNDRVLREQSERWRALAVLGLVATAAPFLLITWGQQYIDTGIAAILNASAPIWTALLALGFVRSERVSGLRLTGILVGFLGIVLLIGFEPGGGDRAVLGSLAVVGGAALFAVGALYAGRRLEGVSSLGVALGALIWASVFTLPLGLARMAGHEVTWDAGASVLALGAGATGVAYLLYFGLIMGAGPSRAILVTYLVPSFAVVFGVTLLDEGLTVQALVGLALVLVGVALGTGTWRPASLRG